MLPLGLGKKTIPLRPFKEAIIYRNFIQGAGTRAIAVGYPEKISLAFDANDLRLAMIWQGPFFDAAKHWTDRGQGFEGPLGDNVMSFPNGPAFASLEKADSPWPKTATKSDTYKFIGYRLTADERPTFDYSIDGIKIEDFPNPAVTTKETTLKRTFKLSGEGKVSKLYFRAAVGKKIEGATDSWYKIDGWKIMVGSSSTPIIRTSDGKQELLVPIEMKEGKMDITLEYAW